MREAANWPSPIPRLIFISDMGDALSAGIPFAYLDQEIIRNVNSPPGRHHLWLWLTKRPSRMARFGNWLTRRGVAWPENLVAMTTVTSARTLGRVDALLEVPSRFKGLSIEPLFEPVAVPLTGIDWVIVGGGSDVLAKPFHVEWALELRERCKAAGVAFFLKQMGKNPFFRGQPLSLANRHGGDWGEWKRRWKTRQLPAGFYAASPAASSI
jgi:protein gp37